MAKKARVPPPPRRVQAPKVRTGREHSKGGGSGSINIRISKNVLLGAVVVVVVAGGLIGYFATKSSTPKPPKIGVSIGDMTTLPGIMLTKPPWGPNNGAKLKPRLQTLGIPELGQEQLAYHIHQHLDIFVDGKPVPVPAFIGISPKPVFFADLHVHDTRGVIHVESATNYDYTLGQFFGVWGLRLSKTCIGGLCVPAGQRLKVYVNGRLFLGDPTRVVLTSHEEFAIVFGTPPTHIPSHFAFQPGE